MKHFLHPHGLLRTGGFRYTLLLLLWGLGAGMARAAAPPAEPSPLRQLIVNKLSQQPSLTLDLYVMSQCPFGVQAEQALIPLVREFGPRVDFRLHYIVAPAPAGGQDSYRSLHGPAEVAENIRQLVIAERFPDRWLDYLLARADNYQSDDWQAAARQTGIEVGEVQRLALLPTASARLRSHSLQTQVRSIRSSPTVLIDGEPYQGPILPPTAKTTATACDVNADCNDNNDCTIDACVNNNCVYQARNCEDNNACTIDRCDPVLGCSYTQVSCDDNDPLTMDSCNPKTGCTYTSRNRLYVNQAVGSSGDGTNWEKAFKTLTEALAAANANGDIIEIWVAAGTYTPTASTTDRSASFSMKNGVTILGGFPASGNPGLADRDWQANPTLLSGDIDGDNTLSGNSYHVFSNSRLNATAVLDGFVITGGNANGINFPANAGGGMYNNGVGMGNECSPTIRNCTFRDNAALEGGAMYNAGISGGSSPVLINCLFQDNAAKNGGGIYNVGLSGTSSPVLTNCSFQSNRATSQGGAMYNYGVSGNSSPVLTNCSFQSNTAPSSGGAMYNNGLIGTSSPVLINCVLFGNGGGHTLFNADGATVKANFTLFETGETDFTGSDNLMVAISPFASTSTTELNACSSAINAGSNTAYNALSGPPATDLAGQPRRYNNGTIDLGAYEYQGTPNQPVTITMPPPGGATVCAGSSVTVPVGVSGTTGSFEWYKGDQLVSGQTSATLSLSNVTTADAGSYKLKVIGACNTLETDAYVLVVKALPTASILSNNGPVCAGQTASFTVSGTSGATLTYTLTGQAGSQTLTLTGSPQTLTVASAPANVTLTLVSVTKDGCPVSLSASSTVSVKALPVLTSSGNTSVLYGYGSNCATLTATASTGPASLRWSTGATGGSVQVCPTQTTDYAVTALGANGCAASQTLRVTVVDVRCGSGGVRVCLGGREVCVAGYLVATYQRLGATLGGCGGSAARIGAQESAEVPQQLSLKAYPNPAADAVTVELLAPQAGTATLDVVDVWGRLRQSRRESLVEGRNELELRLGGLPTGVYVIRVLDAAGRQATVRVSKE